MTQTAIRPATLRGDEQAENRNLAWQQIDVLNSKPEQNIQPPSLIRYLIDAQLNVINLQFSFPSRKGNLS